MDDLAQLAELWQAAQLPVATLEKQFTDFQVAENEEGKLVAAIGLQVHASNGRIHSETIADFSLADTLRPELWKRLQTVAQNRGLFRLWTEEAAPWWKKDAGFSPAQEEILQKMPESYGPRHNAWLVLVLKEETADPELVDKEIARFKEMERGRREKLLGRAKAVKIVGTVLATVVFLFSVFVLILLFRRKFFSRH